MDVIVQQTPRGIPFPETGDPDTVPSDLARLAGYLDPGATVPYNPVVTGVGVRIMFWQTGDGDPITLAVPPLVGSVYFDRTRGRLWVPASQTVGQVTTLSWYLIGSDTDAAIAANTNAIKGVTRTGSQTDTVLRAASVAVALTGIPAGQPTQAWTATLNFAHAFATTPIVVAGNENSLAQPNIVVGVQNVTPVGFTVQITRADTPFHLNDQVTIGYVALGT